MLDAAASVLRAVAPAAHGLEDAVTGKDGGGHRLGQWRLAPCFGGNLQRHAVLGLFIAMPGEAGVLVATVCKLRFHHPIPPRAKNFSSQ